MLQAHPDVDVMIGSSQAIAGAEQAVEDAGDEVELIGNGGSRQAVTAVKEGRWFATYVSAEKAAGAKAAELAIEAARGQGRAAELRHAHAAGPARDEGGRSATSRGSTTNDGAARRGPWRLQALRWRAGGRRRERRHRGRAPSTGSSARTAPGSRRWPRSSAACTSPTTASCWSTASPSGCARRATRWRRASPRSPRRSRSCRRAACSRTCSSGVEPRRLGVVDRAALRRRFAELDERTGFGLDPDARVGALRTADQQKVEILRAIARDARLILMDEPTAALTADESERLLEIVRRLAAGGTAIVLVSHYLEEVLASRGRSRSCATGASCARGPAAKETPHTLVAAMIGRALELTFPPEQPPPADAPVRARGARAAARAARSTASSSRCGPGRSSASPGWSAAGAPRSRGCSSAPTGSTPARSHGRRRLSACATRATPRGRHRDGAREPQGAGPADGALDPRERDARDAAALRDRRASSAATRSASRPRRWRGGSTSARRARACAVGSLSGGNQQKVLFAKWLAASRAC